MTILTDSDILIEVSGGRDKTVVSRWLELSRSDLLILFYAVTAAELWAGARPSEYPAVAALEARSDARTGFLRVSVSASARVGKQSPFPL